MPVYIEKSGDLVGCYHSGTNKRTTEQGKIELLSQWTMDGWDEQILSGRWNIHITEPGRNNDSSRAERVQGGEKGRRGQAGWQLASRRSNKRIVSRTSKRNVGLGSHENLQEERLKLAEKGNLGWVQREVQPRQWADQVHHLSGIWGLGDFFGLTSIFRRLLSLIV